MREEVMSAGVLFAQPIERERVYPEEESASEAGGWNPENFAREQIRGLVRQVFFSNVARPARQVVFSAMDPETDVKTICRQVGEALALETTGSVAVVGEHLQVLQDLGTYQPGTQDGSISLRQAATRLRGNLWLVPAMENHGLRGTATSLHSYLGAVRREFEYSILEGPPAAESNETTSMAQFADGIILVLSAHRTRRVVARRIKEVLEETKARVLGTVLTDRVFPIPEGIYRRL
jgi:protein-tyrosine kinase